MKVRQSFDVDHPVEVVWRALSDIALVADCMPGAELIGREDDLYKGRISVKLGPITASFIGTAKVTADGAEHQGVVEGQGADSGSGSRVAATLAYSVIPNGSNGAHVEIDSDIKLAGSLAQFGRSNIVNDVARQLTADFSRNLQVRLAEAPTESRSPPVAAEIRGLSLLFTVFWRRFIEAVARRLGRGASQQ